MAFLIFGAGVSLCAPCPVQRITQFDGLYGQTNARPDAEYLFSELSETHSHSFERVIQPHLYAQLFQLFFLATGQATFRGAAGQRKLRAPAVVLIPPTALHGFTFSPEAVAAMPALRYFRRFQQLYRNQRRGIRWLRLYQVLTAE